MKATTKMTTRVAIPAILLVIIFALAGCAGLLSGLTASERVKQLVSDLSSGDVTNIVSNFTSDFGVRGQMTSSTYWDSSPFSTSNGPFTWSQTGSSTGVTPPDVPGVTATELDGTITGATSGFASPVQIYLVADSSGNYLIREFIYQDASSTTTQLYSTYRVR